LAKNYEIIKAIGVRDFAIGGAGLTSKDKKTFVQKLKYLGNLFGKN